jgi:rfaE bifunctional protein kinase chain/domain
LEVQSQDSRLGLAANVAQNVASLGGEAFLVGIVGADGAADELRKKLNAAGVSPDHLIVDNSRPTTRKLRVMSGHHHIVRVDYEHKRYLSSAAETSLLGRVKELLGSADGVIIEDYAKGALSEAGRGQKSFRRSEPHDTRAFLRRRRRDHPKPRRGDRDVGPGLQ